MDKLLNDMVRAIVDRPDEVNISINENDIAKIYELTVGEGDLGKVIGKKGRNINALRIILSAVNAKEGDKRAILEVIE
jgi:hypothetical protein|tara:strand:+ start:100 stop:333 length:234 start_codon:yes stop_codon:yes gene_type:complete